MRNTLTDLIFENQRYMVACRHPLTDNSTIAHKGNRAWCSCGLDDFGAGTPSESSKSNKSPLETISRKRNQSLDDKVPEQPQ
jgi:hypothetical protein